VKSLKKREIAAGEFKARCLQLMDEVDQNRIELIITKRGRPVAKLVPVEPENDETFIGSMRGTATILGDIVSSDPGEWPDPE